MPSDKIAAKRAAKAEVIKAAARQCLAERGAAALSLREVARNMGETSSALYRYFPNRDALLTALIIDAYNDLGDAAELAAASSEGKPTPDRIVELASVIRSWASTHLQEYSLIFGSPIPNYEAPASTIMAASRIPSALASILSNAELRKEPFGQHLLAASVLNQENLEQLLPNCSPDVQARCLLVWSSIFGLISFERFGHFVGSVIDVETYFQSAMFDLAQHLGLATVKK